MLEAANRGRVNIKDLALEQPVNTSGKPFDPRSDIGERDWQGILRRLREERDYASFKGSEYLASYAMTAANAVFLRPERRVEIVPEPEILDSCIWGARILRDQNLWGEYLAALHAVRMLEPNLQKETKPEKETWSKVIRRTKGYADSGNWDWYFSNRHGLLLHYPDRAEKLIPDELTWKRLNIYLEGIKMAANEGDSSWSDVSTVTSEMRQLNPRRFGEIAYKPSEWTAALNHLNDLRQNNQWGLLSSLAVDLTILAADSVSITEKGIQLVNNPSFRPTAPGIPTQRRF